MCAVVFCALTAASKLGPHLVKENATALLERAVHATRREVEVLVAEVAPRPDLSAELEATIARPRTLLRHRIPSGDIAAIVELAMTDLVERLERTRCGKVKRPRPEAEVSTSRGAAGRAALASELRRTG